MSLLSRRMMMTNTENGGSEMDKWETIIDYTHSGEPLEHKVFKVDDNGRPFKLRKVSVFIDSAPTTDAVSKGYSFNVSMTSNPKNGGIGVVSCPISNNPHKYGRVIFERLDYGMYPTYLANSYSEQVDTHCLVERSIGNYGYYFVDKSTGEIKTISDFCELITVGSHYQKVVTAGTRVIVKGVRV